MLSSNNHMAAASSPSNSLCEGSISPSSAHSHSQPSTRELDSSQHSLRNDTSSDDPTDFSALRGGQDSLANLPANIEMHPQNDTLSSTSTSHQQFIKRPLNAYMIWTRQERRKILTGEPKKKMNEVSKAIQMGERWKKMSDKEKKPYFEMARKFALEHKQALQEHPELTYAPSKKKGPKPDKDGKHSGKDAAGADQSLQSTPCAGTPERSTTPRQQQAPPPQQGGQPTPMFLPFQTPFNTGAMQIAQVLGVRTPVTAPPLPTNSYGLPLVPSTGTQGAFIHPPLTAHQQQAQQQPPPNFLPPQLQQTQRFTPQIGTIPSTSALSRATSGQVLDLYYTSLCQPAFPTITESPVSTLSMYPPQYLLDQYNQHFNQPQGNNNSGTAPHF